MLSPDYLLRVSEGAEEIAEELHADIMNRVIERVMTRIGRGDGYLLTAQDKWQLQVLTDAGYLLEDIQKEIAQRVGIMQTEISEAMEDAGVKAVEYDDAVYQAAGLSTKPLQQSPALIRIMQRNYEATMGEWVNFTGTMATATQQSFIKACDKAYQLAMSGTVSYSQAVKEALDTLVADGTMVTYPSGHTDTIETATMRAVRTGISQASGQITDARMDEMGWDIILVSSHMGARPGDGAADFRNHAWWQGKFYSRSGKDKRFPPWSVCGMGHVQGIHGAGCRHSHGPGDGEHNPYEQYDTEENRKAYELQQRQCTLERRIRDTKRQTMNWKTARDNATDDVVKADLDFQYQRKAALLQKQNKAYNDFCEENSLKKRSDRISIAKWDRQQAAAARGAASRHSKATSAQDGLDLATNLGYTTNGDKQQFERYREVLKDKVPASLTEFQQMKRENPSMWDTLKRQYRVVNQYKVDSGEFTVDEILDMDKKLITEKRQNFKSRYKKSGNVAGAYVDQEYYLAHSKISHIEEVSGYRGNNKLVTLRADRTFRYIDVKKMDGSFRSDTFQDTEAKLFEEFAAMYASRPFKSITMISERGMCDSCKGVMEQFKVRFPDVNVRVISNKKVEGNVWKYRR